MLGVLKKSSTATRLSFGLVALTLSVLSLAQLLGIYPDTTQAMIDGRLRLCKAIAVHCAAAVRNEVDIDNLNAITSALVAQNTDVRSVGVRGPDGQLMMKVGQHERFWKEADPDRSTPQHVHVPIIKDSEQWGTIEICFEPLFGRGVLGWLRHPVIGTMLFMGISGFLLYRLYLRRTLKILNPQSVIPQRVQAMLDTLTEGVVVLDGKDQIVLANQAFATSVDSNADELQGKCLSDLEWILNDDDQSEVTYPWTTAVKEGHTEVGVPLKLPTAAAGVRTLMVNAAPIIGGDGGTRGALATFDDVTAVEKKNVQLNKFVEMLQKSRDQVSQQNEELKRLATTDVLTGCLNRRSLFERFDALWRIAEGANKDVGCVLFDIDHFKSVNDTHGHAVGDDVLRQAGEVLRDCADEMDLVCRYGGEEFCVLIPHGTIERATEVGEHFRQKIEERRCGGLDVTASFGVSAKALGATSPQELLDQADQALYAAKRGGRNRVVRWDQIPVIAASEPEPADKKAQAEPAKKKAQRDPGIHIAFQAVTGLLAALTQRHAGTGQHCKRVADLCVLVAKDTMLPRDCFVLEVAALLHDLGKLGIPDTILLKPGPLTDEEWHMMRLHEEMGVAIVDATFDCEELTRIIRVHHAWFGGGHPTTPDLPKGTQIPEKARLLAIADAYDAMVSDRPYRKGRSRDEAFVELRRCAGTQFDPELVERFIEGVAAYGEPDGSDTASAKRQITIQLDQALEKLAQAFEGEDFKSLPAIAGQLKLAAARRGMGSVVQLASELEQATTSDIDLDPILELTSRLLELCRRGQDGPDPPAAASDTTVDQEADDSS